MHDRSDNVSRAADQVGEAAGGDYIQRYASVPACSERSRVETPRFLPLKRCLFSFARSYCYKSLAKKKAEKAIALKSGKTRHPLIVEVI